MTQAQEGSTEAPGLKQEEPLGSVLWECRAKVPGTETQEGNQGLGLEQALVRLGEADFSV